MRPPFTDSNHADRQAFMLRNAVAIAISLCITSCATSPEAKLKQAYKRAEITPWSDHPALFVKLEKEGKITAQTRDEWTADWERKTKENVARRNADIAASDAAERKEAAQVRRWLASLTPAQRLDLAMRERELQQRRSEAAWQIGQQMESDASRRLAEIDAERQAAAQAVVNNSQRQADRNAYIERTRAISQPVNVRHSGTINQNIRGRVNVYGY